jgi:sulfur-carrier protein
MDRGRAHRVDGLGLFPCGLAAFAARGRAAVTLLYFAWVRQKVGVSEEVVALPAEVKTVGDLAAWLAGRGEGYADAFGDAKRLRAARNQEHVGFEAKIAEGDEVAFFPPVTGG